MFKQHERKLLETNDKYINKLKDKERLTGK